MYSDFVIRHCILSFVAACVLSPLHRIQNGKCIFALCLSAVSSGFGLVSVIPELRLSIHHLHYLIEFMLSTKLALNCFIWQVCQNCASFVTEICYWVIMILRYNCLLCTVFIQTKGKVIFVLDQIFEIVYISTRKSRY